MCCWKGREPLGPRDSLCFCLRVSDLILTPSGRDRAGPGEGLWEEWWCLRTWLRRGQQGCRGAGSVCVLRGGVLGEWDVARDLFLLGSQVLEPPPCSARALGCLHFPLCTLSSAYLPCGCGSCLSSSPAPLPTQQLGLSLLLHGGCPASHYSLRERGANSHFPPPCQAFPTKSGWQGRRKGCEVISSPRDPGLNRLMVGRMLGSVCTCSPSRRACPLQHPECTWVCVVVMEHNMAPGGRGEDPVGSQTAGEGRRLGLWHVNTMGAREAPPPTGVRARPPLLAARPWRQDGAACSGMPPQACD